MIEQEYKLLLDTIVVSQYYRTSKDLDRIIKLDYGSNGDYLGVVKEFADRNPDKSCGFLGDDTDMEILRKIKAKVQVPYFGQSISLDYVFVSDGCVYRLDYILEKIPNATIVVLG